jgi:tetratricopeptide (TPR) repeat protein
MFKKVILQGRLDFGKTRSFDKVFKMFHHMVDVRFKNALLIDEDNFNQEEYLLEVPRKVVQASGKYFKNTVDLFSYLAQYAVSGTLGAWMLGDGKLLESHIIEPQSDKVVVQAYLHGRELSETEGKEQEALEALTKALEKYDKHSQAYERRGYINYKLGNVEDAYYDLDKSIRIDPNNAEAYMYRAQINYQEKKYKEASHDFEMATKCSVALQDIYWTARRLKGKCHIHLEEWTKAEFDLKLFVNRKIAPSSPNFLWKKWAYAEYGMVLIELGKYEEAVEAFNTALAYDEGHGEVNRADQLLKRGIAKQKLGGSGYLSDWKEAAQLGQGEAKTLLESYN